MKTKVLCAAGLVAALSLGAAAFAQSVKQLSIATGTTGGVYYPIGGGFANLIGKAIPGFGASAEVTGGSVANLQLIGAAKADIAFVQVDAAFDAINGVDKFKTKLPVQALVVMYPNHMQLVTIEGTGITKLEDLKGRRISTGAPGSATEVFAFRLIEAAGLDKDKDMTRERLSPAESANAIKDKKLDAFFFVSGLPTSAVTDLAATPGTRLKILELAHFVPKLVAKYGRIYSASVIPKATYPGMDRDVPNTSVWNLMAVNASMPEELAYQLTKLMLEKREDLGTVHKEALGIIAANQTADKAGIPFHPGALRYFTEQGIKVE